MANRFLSNITINDSYTLPSTDGSQGQVITTDGSGNLSFSTANSNFIYYNVKNSSGATINKGTAVMASGTDGNSGHILIEPMIADGSVEPRYFMGVLESTLDNGEIGRVIHFGELSQFNTNDFQDGDILWCDPANPGGFTTTEPDGPNLKIAAVIVVNAATNGKIKVRVQGNAGLHELHDVKLVSEANGDLLQWNNTLGVWENKTLASIADARYVNVSGDTMTGSLNFNTTNTGLVWSMNTDGAYIKFFNTGDSDTDSRLEYATSDNGNEYHRFMVSGTERMRLTESGLTVNGAANVGLLQAESTGTHYIGNTNTNPTLSGYADNLLIKSTSNTGVTIYSATTGFGSIHFADSDSTGAGFIRYRHNDSTLELSTESRVLINQNLDVSGDISTSNIEVNGNILLTGTPTTANQGRTIDFTGFDKEGTTDFTDRAYIRHTTNVGGHTGSVLEISSQNDSTDGIAFTTHASSPLKHNGNDIVTSANIGSYPVGNADTVDGLHASQFVRSDADDTFTGTLTLAGNISFSGNTRTIDLSGGTTSSQNRLLIGEQNLYGVGFRWDSGTKLHFDGFYNTSTAGAENRDLGYIDVNTREWNIENLIVNGIVTFNGQEVWQKGSDIGGSANLNNYASSGYYHQNSNSAAASGSNYPIGQAGMLEVTADGVMVYQKYTHYNTSDIYTRSYYNGTWYSWGKIWDSSNDGSGSGLDADLLDGLHSSSFFRNGDTTLQMGNNDGFVYDDGANVMKVKYDGTEYPIWTSANDGSGSGLDADLLDGVQGSSYLRSNTSDTFTGTLTLAGTLSMGTNSISTSSGAKVTTPTGYLKFGSLNSSWVHYETDRPNHYFYEGIWAGGYQVQTSDARIKENVVTIDNALDKVNSLRGVYYNRIGDKDKIKEIGFIAQEVNEVVPELAAYAEDMDEWAVKYANFVGLHNEAIKELSNKIDQLQAEIELLKQA